MPRRWSLLLLFLASTSLLNAQPLSKKEWKWAMQAHFDQYQQLSTAKNYRYQEKTFERDEFFLEIPTTAEIAKSRKLLAETAKITILAEDTKLQLAFEAQGSGGYPDLIGDLIDVTFIEAQLKDENGKRLQLENSY